MSKVTIDEMNVENMQRLKFSSLAEENCRLHEEKLRIRSKVSYLLDQVTCLDIEVANLRRENAELLKRLKAMEKKD